MLEKLVEYWLDSSTERGYQPVFCQMLAARGHRVLHSTRHAPIEFGKDVISQDGDGTYCAFQLKGNPGERLTLSQYRDILPQLLQLIHQPIIYPGVPIGLHRSFLVTNGQVEEEVLRSIDDLNRGLPAEKLPLELINRGTLLNWANDLGSRLWPSAPKDLHLLLALLVKKGRGPFPIKKLHSLLSRHYRLAPDDDGIPSSQAAAVIGSAAVLTAVSLRGFSTRQNHFAIVTAWTIFYAYSIAMLERHRIAPTIENTAPMRLAASAVEDALGDLCDEVAGRQYMAEGDVLADVPFRQARRILLTALMAVYWFWEREPTRM